VGVVRFDSCHPPRSGCWPTLCRLRGRSGADARARAGARIRLAHRSGRPGDRRNRTPTATRSCSFQCAPASSRLSGLSTRTGRDPTPSLQRTGHPPSARTPKLAKASLDQRLAPSGWSINGAKRSKPVATNGKWERPENGSNKPKPLPPIATSCRSERMVRRGSTVRVRQRALSKDLLLSISRRLGCKRACICGYQTGTPASGVAHKTGRFVATLRSSDKPIRVFGPLTPWPLSQPDHGGVTETIRPSSTVICSKMRRRIFFRSDGSVSWPQNHPKLASAAAASPSSARMGGSSEFGLEHALMGFVLLAGEVADEV
jgi:hypothetical protein